MFWRKNKSKEPVSAFDFPNADKEERQHSLLGYGLMMTGDIKFAGTLRVDGRVEGRVNVKPEKRGTLVVSRNAVINGPVMVTNLIVDGTINGNVYASGRVECRSNGKIRGEVRYLKMNIAEGGTIEGRCIQHDDAQRDDNTVVSVVRGEDNEPLQMSNFLSKEG